MAGIDTGGTFTDIVVLDGGGMRHCKVLSTPDDPSRAIFEGLDRLGLAGEPLHVIHGTTVGTNAVLENKGARVAYVTSAGFADVLSIGRQNRERVYALEQPAVEPPVPEELCFEVPVRIAADGALLGDATGRDLANLAERIRATNPESVAVNLLFSFLRPEKEREIAEALGEQWFISLSSLVLPELREYERGIATWLDASVGPVIARYLDRLQRRLPRAVISVMQSSGTTITASQAPARAVRLLLSGPAGGLSAALLVGRVCGRERQLTFDMGGTSTDVSLLDGEIPVSSEHRIGRWPLTITSVDIHTIGAGGGSIARVDAGGLLLVGPESAGADPGPACYGRGGEHPTVTDANLVLGRLPRDTLLGGYLPLDVEAANGAMDRLAGELGCGRLEAARGVVRLANEHMARALRVISVERGHDPRGYALLSFGGAGGLHACELAELLDIPEIILPARAGVLSAQGMLASEPGRELSWPVLREVGGLDGEELHAGFDRLEREAARQLAEEGLREGGIRFTRRVEMRYRGQSSGIVLDFQPGGDLAEAFHRAHEEAVGHRLDVAVEVVNLRLTARAGAAIDTLEPVVEADTPAQPVAIHSADLDGPVPVFRRNELGAGQVLHGPAIVTETAATSWLAPGWRASSDAWGNLKLTRQAR